MLAREYPKSICNLTLSQRVFCLPEPPYAIDLFSFGTSSILIRSGAPGALPQPSSAAPGGKAFARTRGVCRFDAVARAAIAVEKKALAFGSRS